MGLKVEVLEVDFDRSVWRELFVRLRTFLLPFLNELVGYCTGEKNAVEERCVYFARVTFGNSRLIFRIYSFGVSGDGLRKIERGRKRESYVQRQLLAT